MVYILNQVPFLSVGEDLGCRVERYRSSSKFSGDYIVEDISQDGVPHLRRLIFLNNQNVVQSEAKLNPSKLIKYSSHSNINYWDNIKCCYNFLH